VPGVQVTTLTGLLGLGFANGTLEEARFHNPVNLALREQELFVTDYGNNAVRVLHLDTSTVTTLYQSTSFLNPFGIVVGGPNEIFVQTDGAPNPTGPYPGPRDGTIWRFDTSLATISPELIVQPDGWPRGLLYLPVDAEHAQGRLVFSDLTNHDLRIIDLASKEVTLLAGSAGTPGYADGVGSSALFNRPYGMAFWQNDIVVCDQANRAIRRVALDSTVTTLAGTGEYGLVDGPVATAVFAEPEDIAADAQGNLFISDSGSHRIRVIHDGTVSTLAGSSWTAAYEDGPGSSAKFFGQEGLAATSDGGTVYLADGTALELLGYHHIRVITVPTL
jgi:DNA-binding beta-propeller fold protein YncE